MNLQFLTIDLTRDTHRYEFTLVLGGKLNLVTSKVLVYCMPFLIDITMRSECQLKIADTVWPATINSLLFTDLGKE